MKYSKNNLTRSFTTHFILLILLPFLVISSFLLHISYISSRDDNKRLHMDFTSQVAYNINQQFTFAQNIPRLVLLNDSIIDFFSKPYQDKIDLEYYRTQIYDYSKITSGISSDMKLRMYIENETIPSGFGMFYHLSNILHIPSIQSFYEDDTKDSCWLDASSISSEDFYAAALSLYNIDSFCFMTKIYNDAEPIGIVLSYLPKHLLNLSATGSVNSNVQCVIDNFKLYYNFTSKTLSSDELDAIYQRTDTFYTNKHYVASKHTYPTHPFEIIIITSPFSNQSFNILLLLIFIVFISILFLFFILYNCKLIHDIHYCLDALDESIQNNFTTTLHLNRSDEIFSIASRINYLIEKIRNLISVTIKQEVSAKENQLIALQHQINPHFLYNTMDIFSSRMEINELYEESDAMTCFCSMLRYNINSNQMLATIADELAQVTHYITIQKLREIDITLTTNVSKSLLQVPIIKFILQPIVENSFKYRKPNRTLIISIEIFEANRLIYFKIQDNGIGLSEHKLTELNQSFTSSYTALSKSYHHIGLSNINDRLKLFYGPSHHIVASMEDNQTTFTFSIPIK